MKKKILTDIFNHCQRTNNFVFDDNFIQNILTNNSCDLPVESVTHITNTCELPDIISDKDFYLINIGNNKHQFLRRLYTGFHKLEPISDNEIIEWEFIPNQIGNHENPEYPEHDIFSFIDQQMILQHFLCGDINTKMKVNPIYPNSTVKKLSYTCDLDGMIIRIDDLMVDTDLILSSNNQFSFIKPFYNENSTTPIIDVNMHLLYNPLRCFHDLERMYNFMLGKLTSVCVLKNVSNTHTSIKLYEYYFDPYSIMDIKLIKKAEYRYLKES